MTQLKKAISTSVGRKFVMGISGLALILYLCIHLFGNLTLYSGNGDAFNRYADKMHSVGKLILVIELGLLAFFLIHIYTGIRLVLKNRAARGQGYRVLKPKRVKETDAGEVAPSNISSRNMAISGSVLLLFLIVHVKQFRFSEGIESGSYTTELDGKQVTDLHHVAIDVFQNPYFVGFYMIAMLMVGLHLRHGFWSAFQSLGVMHPKFAKSIHAAGVVIACVLMLGFFFIPAWVYFHR